MQAVTDCFVPDTPTRGIYILTSLFCSSSSSFSLLYFIVLYFILFYLILFIYFNCRNSGGCCERRGGQGKGEDDEIGG